MTKTTIDPPTPERSGRRAAAGAGHWMAAAGPLTLLAVASLIWLGYDAGDPRRNMAAALLGALGLVLLGGGLGIDVLRRPNVRIGLAVVVAVGLGVLEANDIALVVLGFLLAADAMSSLPPTVGWRWVAGLAALTALHFVRRAGEPWAGLLVGLGAGGGYAFMGSAAYATRRAEALLGELRAAHEQLRASAVQAEALAVAQERERLAREMHDTLGHRLTVAAVQLEGAARLVEGEPARAQRIIETVRQEIAEGLTELRATVGALRRPADDAPLPDALARLIAGFDAATGIRTGLDVAAGAGNVAGPTAHALLRAAQEGLTNVQRHSGATWAWVVLARDATGWRIEVRDDGTGLAEGGPPVGDAEGGSSSVGEARFGTASHGLRGLAERAAALGGTLTVDKAPEGGVRVALWVPAAPAPATEDVA